MKKPTVAQLQAEIEALKHRIAALEARPHWPMYTVPWPHPDTGLKTKAPQWSWPPGTILGSYGDGLG